MVSRSKVHAPETVSVGGYGGVPRELTQQCVRCHFSWPCDAETERLSRQAAEQRVTDVQEALCEAEASATNWESVAHDLTERLYQEGVKLKAAEQQRDAAREALREIERVPSTAMMARVYEIARAALAGEGPGVAPAFAHLVEPRETPLSGEPDESALREATTGGHQCGAWGVTLPARSHETRLMV